MLEDAENEWAVSSLWLPQVLFLFYLFIFAALGFELRASYLLGRFSEHRATPPVLFCEGLFSR
jgi:hypothetical protein